MLISWKPFDVVFGTIAIVLAVWQEQHSGKNRQGVRGAALE